MMDRAFLLFLSKHRSRSKAPGLGCLPKLLSRSRSAHVRSFQCTGWIGRCVVEHPVFLSANSLSHYMQFCTPTRIPSRPRRTRWASQGCRSGTDRSQILVLHGRIVKRHPRVDGQSLLAHPMRLMKTPKICELWTLSLEVVWRWRSVEELELPSFWQAFHGHLPGCEEFHRRLMV